MTAENRRSQTKTCPFVNLSTTNLTWTCMRLRLNPDLLDEELVNIRLSHGTALDNIKADLKAVRYDSVK